MRIGRRIGQAAIILAFAVTAGAIVWFFASGYRAYIVHTGSMSPTYKPGSLVIDAPARGAYHPGEVITFRHSGYTTDLVTHRITDITRSGLIHTKGDANATADVWDIRPGQVRGAVLTGIPYAGFVLVYLQQPAGVASVVTVLLGLILLWGLCFPAGDGRAIFLTAVETSPANGERPARALHPTRPRRLRVGRPAAGRAATTTATVAVAGMLVVNVAGGITVIADHSPASSGSEQAAVR